MATQPSATFVIQPMPTEDGPLTLRSVEKWYVQQVLMICNGNVQKAAKLLGVSRATVYRKLDEHGLQRK